MAYSPGEYRQCQTIGQAVLLPVPKDLDPISSARLSQESPLPLYCPPEIRSWGTGRNAATTRGMNNKAFVPDPGFMPAVSTHETTPACLAHFKEDKIPGPS